jgi:nitroreductase
MTNEILECIKERRSIRKYKETQIRDDDLSLILEAATYAPSGSNSQSWLFTAIQSHEILQTLNELVRLAILKWELAEDEYPAKIGVQKAAQNKDFHYYYHAPTLIIASNVPHYANAMADCSLALQNIFLAAHSLGLGSCWINPITWVNGDREVREYLATLGIPGEHVICGSAAIGFIDGDRPKAPAKKANTIRIIKG